MDANEMERQYYSRQTRLFSDEQLARFEKLTIGVFGIGCSGSPIVELCARVGFRNLYLIDNDVVEVSNLNRQTLYAWGDLGRPKVEVAEARLRSINPFIKIITSSYPDTFVKTEEFGKLNIVVDACDDHKFKVLLSRLCKKNGQVLVHTSSFGFRGTVVFFRPGEPYYEEFFGLPTVHKRIDEICDDDFETYRNRVVDIVGFENYSQELIDDIKRHREHHQVVASTNYIAGSLVVNEVIKQYIYCLGSRVSPPNMLNFDLLENKFGICNLGASK